MIILFSGPAAGGKSTICNLLEQEHSFLPIKSSKYLREIAQKQAREATREILQEIGDQLDADTDFGWLIDAVAKPQMAVSPDQEFWFVDSVRKEKQVDHFKSTFKNRVFHIHVTAPEEVLQQRFTQRNVLTPKGTYEKPYSEHISHPNEISSRSLDAIADFVIDSSRTKPESACEQILERAS